MTLNDLKPLEFGTILKVSVDHQDLANRLKMMGLVVGASVQSLQRSPTGGVVSFRLRNGVFALEASILQCIQIQRGAV